MKHVVLIILWAMAFAATVHAVEDGKAIAVEDKEHSGVTLMGQRWAMVAGINEYSNVPKLRFARQDAQAHARTLVRRCGFPNDNIVLLANTAGKQCKPRSNNKPPAEEDRLPSKSDHTWSNSLGMKFTVIKPGEFLMGDGDSAKHTKIGRGFYMGITEVTQGQWKAVMGTTPWEGKHLIKEGDEYPATFVSWNCAVNFCKKLSAKEGKAYRLPTEAEWEYACRAGTNTKFSFGDDETVLGDYAWYIRNSRDKGEKYAHEVGQKTPNAWGLYDMHGNVWEWCSDFYKAGDTWRVLRGGAWPNQPGYCNSTIRFRGSPINRGHIFGFRVCLSFARAAAPAKPQQKGGGSAVGGR